MKIIQDYTILEVIDREGKNIIYRGKYESKIFILKTFQGESPTSEEIAQL
ncbi:hypothetical protein HC931_27625 [Candidatus Gracilibacteria bacterium]|nr:hypothetical protein [Candidatus Gracilibacteria bacterium]NJM90086.1 hypothetical protein [Hydrococcus sp. RU_2_2]NJP21932.1 hypothetical protein [Hydrococcus sp. CRU_1_1]NJQ97813.1 hypothetical protein [Hydrococcus sp. CSU_1_8]